MDNNFLTFSRTFDILRSRRLQDERRSDRFKVCQNAAGPESTNNARICNHISCFYAKNSDSSGHYPYCPSKNPNTGIGSLLRYLKWRRHSRKGSRMPCNCRGGPRRIFASSLTSIFWNRYQECSATTARALSDTCQMSITTLMKSYTINSKESIIMMMIFVIENIMLKMYLQFDQ